MWLAAFALCAFQDATSLLLDDAFERGVAVLLATQESYVPDRPVGPLPAAKLADWQAAERARLAAAREAAEVPGEWPYEGVYRVAPGGRIPSGYRVGGTAIAALALLSAPRQPQASEASLVTAVERAIDFVLSHLDEADDLASGSKSGYDVRGWGFTYALALALGARVDPRVDEARRDRLDAAVPGVIARLVANSEPDGGWNYAGRGVSPFQTGATLLELFGARAAGFEVPDELVERALDALQRARTDSTAFAYSGIAKGPVAGPGSAARSSVAELALFLGGRTSDADLARAVALFFDGWDALRERAGQQGTHAGVYGIAPYYFLFGHAYAAEAIERLPEPLRSARRGDLRALLARTRDENGAWNDRIFPRSEAYGTAMALLALGAPARPARAAWTRAETGE